ncbi:MAG: leucyl aminopeptidase [Nocardioides sp.]|uniref:leucyl aminopeptidase n=1 Tax=Nocardioides sp. TaxID=35761 RepID=UPI0039E57597
MTSYTLRTVSPAKTRAEAVAIGVFQGPDGVVPAPGADEVADAFGRRLRGLLATLGATGKAGEVVRVPTGGTIASPLLLVVGLGKAGADPESSPTPDAVRRAAGAVARTGLNATSVALCLPAGTPELIRAVTEGHLLGGYSFTRYKSAREDRPVAEVIVASPIARRREAIDAFARARILAEAVNAARDWVNTPPGDLTPPAFAEAVVTAADEVDAVSATVFDADQLADLGCGGILAVGQGSAAPPRLVELAYSPADPVAHLALVGKGITFDSGGLTLKPGQSMTTMKSDMAGAAAVVQATLAIARLGLPVQVSAYAPMAENMVSGSALKPGDVVVHYGGRTTEAQNMDAEGRLVLADALVRATEVEPDVIIDVATLTGAMVVALGEEITGVLGSEEVVQAVLAAAESAGELMWPMPIPEIMDERIRSSKVADLAQTDWIRWGAGLYAAAFLREFTAGLPWAHLDIAGPSYRSSSPSGHLPAGGTGAAVATLVDYARALAAPR